MGIRNMDHVGIVVDDLAAATEFFVELGLEVEGQARVEGEWAGNVIGLDDVRSDIVMLRTPGGSSSIELSKFLTPDAESDAVPAPVNRLGIRHIAFIVDDLEGMLTRLRTRGVQLVGEVQNYQDVFLLCYVRGPRGSSSNSRSGSASRPGARCPAAGRRGPWDRARHPARAVPRDATVRLRER